MKRSWEYIRVFRVSADFVFAETVRRGCEVAASAMEKRITNRGPRTNVLPGVSNIPLRMCTPLLTSLLTPLHTIVEDISILIVTRSEKRGHIIVRVGGETHEEDRRRDYAPKSNTLRGVEEREHLGVKVVSILPSKQYSLYIQQGE